MRTFIIVRASTFTFDQKSDAVFITAEDIDSAFGVVLEILKRHSHSALTWVEVDRKARCFELHYRDPAYLCATDLKEPVSYQLIAVELV